MPLWFPWHDFSWHDSNHSLLLPSELQHFRTVQASYFFDGTYGPLKWWRLGEEGSPLMTLGLVTVVGLGEVGSATPLSLWSVFWHLGSQWQAVCCIRGKVVWSWWGEYFAGVLACCRGGLPLGLKSLPSLVADVSYWGLLLNCQMKWALLLFLNVCSLAVALPGSHSVWHGFLPQAVCVAVIFQSCNTELGVLAGDRSEAVALEWLDLVPLPPEDFSSVTP